VQKPGSKQEDSKKRKHNAGQKERWGAELETGLGRAKKLVIGCPG
jgi:hypothetical protein